MSRHFDAFAGRASTTAQGAMREILRTNDPVVLSYATALLGGLGLTTAVADEYMSALEGSIGAWPRRILVDADVEVQARRILTDAGLGVWLVPEGRV